MIYQQARVIKGDVPSGKLKISTQHSESPPEGAHSTLVGRPVAHFSGLFRSLLFLSFPHTRVSYIQGNEIAFHKDHSPT